MIARRIAEDDVYAAMVQVRTVLEQFGGTYAVASKYTWKCQGPDLSGNLLQFVVAIEEDTIIVTVYGPGRG